MAVQISCMATYLLSTHSSPIQLVVSFGIVCQAMCSLAQCHLTMQRLRLIIPCPNLVKPWSLLTSLTLNILENLSTCLIYLAIMSVSCHDWCWVSHTRAPFRIRLYNWKSKTEYLPESGQPMVTPYLVQTVDILKNSPSRLIIGSR